MVDDRILDEGECAKPDDLSIVAATVFGKLRSQRELVIRFPLDEMATARPNEGTLLTAALMRERVIGCVLSLNYDMSVVHALSELDSRGEVSILAGPEDHNRLGQINFIFLHRNVHADADDLIIRRDQLETAWRNRWEEVVVARFLGAPATVFAGLGSPAEVLTETMRAIMAAIAVRPTLVDPRPFGDSEFARALGIEERDYVQSAWSQFMRVLAERVALQHVRDTIQACSTFIEANAFEAEDFAGLEAQLRDLGLIGAGRLRAAWMLSPSPYAPCAAVDIRLVADLLCLVGSVERRTETTARLSPGGIVYFVGKGVASVIVASGSGVLRWTTVEAEVRHRYRQSPFAPPDEKRPRFAVIAGAQGQLMPVTPPVDIVGSFHPESLVSGPDLLELVDADAVRRDDGLARKLVS